MVCIIVVVGVIVLIDDKVGINDGFGDEGDNIFLEVLINVGIGDVATAVVFFVVDFDGD